LTVTALALRLVFSGFPAAGQTSTPSVRVRLSGVDAYDIPGVIHVGSDKAEGRPASFDREFVTFLTADGTTPTTILRPGARVVGDVRSVSPAHLELALNGGLHVRVPLDSISRIELFESRASRGAAVAAGAIVGIATALGAPLVIISACGDEGRCATWIQIAAFVAAPALGIAAGVAMRGGRWRQVTIEQLRQMMGTRQPGLQ
jgi:hypothetical protein